MELKDQLARESDERVLATIRAFLTLTDYGVFGAHTFAINCDLLHAAGNRLAAAAARIAELEHELEGKRLELMAATVKPAPTALRIVPSDVPDPNKETDRPIWQDFDVHFAGEIPHYCMIRVVRRMRGADLDHPAYAAIERRLLAGNPVEV